MKSIVREYRKKPVIIEAIQFFNGDGKNTIKECIKFCNNHADLVELCNEEYVLKIRTLEGEIIANTNDYIIKGIMGEFYPCKPDIFEKTYEKII